MDLHRARGSPRPEADLQGVVSNRDVAWPAVTVEAQNLLHVYTIAADGRLGPAPAFSRSTLIDPQHAPVEQAASTIHVHPNGRFAYVGNRSSSAKDYQGKRVFAGGENSIAVFSIERDTGEPTRIQSVETRGVYPRTFSLDPSARLLVVGNHNAFQVLRGGEVQTVPASIALFRVRDDGRLDYAKSYDMFTDLGRNFFWVGIIPLP